MMKLLEKNLPGILNSLLLFFMLVCETEVMSGMKLSYIFPWSIITLLLTCFCSMKLRNKIITAVSFFLCTLVTACMISWEDWSSFAQGFYTWLQDTAVAEESAAGLYQLLLSSFFSILCFCFQLLAEKLFFLRILTSAAMFICLCVDLFTSRDLHHLTVACIFGYIVITYVIWTQKYWKKHKNNPTRPYLMWILPFLACYIILMAVMPAPEKPYDWQFVKGLYQTVNQSLLTITQKLPFIANEDFQVTTSGFSEDGRLLGNLVKDNQAIMQIQAQKTLKTNVYLTGKVYDTFYGNQWVQTNTLQERDRKLDALETLYAVWLYDKDLEQNYVRNTTLSINYLDFHTRFLFSPLKTWKVDMDEITYTDVDGNLLFENLQGYGTTYNSYYFQINVDHPLFYELLETPLTPDQEEWKIIQRRHTQAFEDRFSLTDLENHRKNIHEIYGTSYPLSEEVMDYLAQITEGAVTDIEKLKAIEAALSSYEYTLTPGKLPDDVTTPEAFMDYFLLESKQGFCSYFATAFVLLARTEGIPARYVEGFCVPIAGGQLTTVYGNMAHAWPEVYIDGVGWIPFEPTPGYARIRYTPWEEVVHQEPLPTDDFEEEPEEAIEEETPEDLPEEAPPIEEKSSTQFLLIIGYVILLLIAILVLLLVIDKYLTKRRYRKWSPEKKFHAEIQQNLQLLALLGYSLGQGETLEELQKRAWAVIHYEKDDKEYVLGFLTLYEEVLYGKQPVSQEMLEQVQTEHGYLLEMLKNWKYWLYLYYKISHGTGGR